MARPTEHYAGRIKRKAANAIDVYRYERARGVRWASSVKHYGEDASREYGDRFLIELIQNAYDANPKSSSTGKVGVLLDLGEDEHGVLYVANTGRPFTDDNFDAITDIAQSDKEPGEGIGNKGVGFKSVLQVSQWPEIYSSHPGSKDRSAFDGYCFRLPRQADVARLVDEEDLEDVLRDVPPYALPIPVTDVPPRVTKFRRDGYCTVVRLPLDDERAALRVEIEIGRLTASTTPLLLFLERIDLLHLRVHSADGLALRDDRLHRRVERMVKQDALAVDRVNLGEQGIFTVATRPVSSAALSAAIADSAPEISDRWASWKQDSTVSVALQLHHTDSEWRFYTFLPMGDSEAPLPAHVNAPFFTKLDRNSVRFSVRYNAFLLEEIARLCIEAAFWIRDNSPDHGQLCLDLISWNSTYLLLLTNAFEESGKPLHEAELVPIVSLNGAPNFGAVTNVRRWDVFGRAMNTLTAGLLREHTGAAIVDPALGSPRIENLGELRLQLSNGTDDAHPTDAELAEWLEIVAKRLWRAVPTTTGEGWVDFYDDVANAFVGRDADALHGRRLIIDADGKLVRCGVSDDARRSRTIFFAPVRDQTEGEEDVEVAFDVKLPTELAKAISFTREDLNWHFQSEESRKIARRCRKFLEDSNLVHRYRTQDVLAAVQRFLRNPRNHDDIAVLRAALRFAYRFKDKANDQTLRSIGLRVPTNGDWRPASEALFSAHWPNTQGPSLVQLIQLAGSVSPSLAELHERLLLSPATWAPDDTPMSDWTAFLKRLGVRDGLHPVSLCKERFRSYGPAFTPRRWAHFADIDEGFADLWDSKTADHQSFSQYPQTMCTSVTELWGLPGQFEFEQFSAAIQEQYATLVIKNLDVWQPDCIVVGSRRAKHPQDVIVKWPSPMQIFLREAHWLPVVQRDEPRFCTPDEAWLFDDGRSEIAPKFAPLVTASLRRLAQQNSLVAERLRSWCGIRCWNDPRDAPDVAEQLYAMVADGTTELSDMGALTREYERAIHHSLHLARDWWPEQYVPSVLVRRGEVQVVAVELDEGHDPVFVDDGTDRAKRKLLEEVGAPIVCAEPADGGKIAAALKAAAPGVGVQVLSDVHISIEIDGIPLDDETPSVALTAGGNEWLVSLVVAALEYRSGQFRRRGDRSLREAASRLRSIRLIPARHLRLSIGGHTATDRMPHRDAFSVLTPSHPAIVVTEFSGEVGWDTLEKLAHPIAAVVGAPEIGSVLFESLVRMRRGHLDDDQAPTLDQCAGSLDITRSQIDDVIARLSSEIDVLRDRIPLAVACLSSIAAGEEMAQILSNANSEDDVRVALSTFDLPRSPDLLDMTKTAPGLRELRDALKVTYRDFNLALEGMGRPTLADPDAHEQAFTYFVKRNRDGILCRLHQVFRPRFADGRPLDDYVRLRSFPGMGRDPSWLDSYEVPDDVAMQIRVDDWLRKHGASPLSQDVGVTKSVNALQTANRRQVTASGDAAARLVRSWCIKTNVPCPELWSGGGCGGRLADWADEQGLLDFVTLNDLQPLLGHMGRERIWPPDMPHSFEAAKLRLTEDDLDRGASEEEHQRARQHAERSTVTLGSRRFGVDPDCFTEIAAEVRQTLPSSVLRTPFRTEPGPMPAARNQTRDQSGPKSFYRNMTRFSEGQRQVIGLAAEVIALDWLKEQYATSGVVTWRSGYKDMVEGGREGDDTLGYDIDVQTKSGRFMFEVKGAAEDGTEFELTQSEIDAARRNTKRDAYRVVYIQFALDPQQAKPILLPNPFSLRGSDVYRVVGNGLRYKFSPKE